MMRAPGIAAVRPESPADWAHWTPLTRIAFVICFIGSVVASSVPSPSASDKDWVAAYATRAQQARHLATGVLLVLAALSLMSFLTHHWTRVVAARQYQTVGPLPVVAAGVSAGCIAVGGILMAGASGNALLASAPIPSAEILRTGSDFGFAMVGIAGMLAAALSIALLSVQARSTGLFGGRLLIFSLVVAALLLGAVAFIPIFARLIWLVVVAVVLMRDPAAPACE